MLAIFEPHISGDRSSDVCNRMLLTNCTRVEATSFAGGVWLFCNEYHTSLHIENTYDRFIHAKVLLGNNSFHLIVVYAPSNPSDRSVFWQDIDRVFSSITEPLFMGGDFNCILNSWESSSRSGNLSSNSNLFQDWVNKACLIDIGFPGSSFTWFFGASESTFKAKRLDRVLASDSVV